MDDQALNQITINDHVFTKSEVLAGHTDMYLQETANAELIDFLKDWFSEEHFLFVQTSGSTGEPKRFQVSKQAMISSARMTGRFLGLQEGMTALLCLSPKYIAGKMMVVRALVWKLNLVTTAVESNPLKEIHRTIDFCAMVPLQVDTVLEQTPDQIKHIRNLIIGGSALSPQLESRLQKVSTSCFHTYGMTETLSHIALRPINGPDKSEWFEPLEDIRISLDERDCLRVDAPMLSANRLLTNDIAVINQDGKFQILGRIDDVLVTAGLKIHPQMVEQKVALAIKRSCVLSGIPDARAGLSLVLVIEGDASTTEIYQIWEFLATALTKEEMPRRLYFVDKIPLLESGKIDRSSVFSKIQH